MIDSFDVVGVDHLKNKLIGRLNPHRRLYIRPENVVPTLRQFSERGVRYVVLRWFEDLADIKPGHDLDILVDDGDACQFERRLSRWPSGTMVDLFTPTGAAGMLYRPASAPPVPAFPPELAERILAGARLTADGVCVPSPEDHFFSLAYHAVYLKGLASGLPAEAGSAPARRGSHDYAEVLVELGRRIGIAVPEPLSLVSADEMLAAHGWRPPPVLLWRLARVNPWVRRHFFPCTGSGINEDKALSIFFVGPEVVEAGLRDAVESALESRGFEVFSKIMLDKPPGSGASDARIPAAVPIHAGALRGTICAIVAFDVLHDRGFRRDTGFENWRVFKALQLVDGLISAKLGRRCRPGDFYPTVSSADAHQVASLLMGADLRNELENAIEGRHREMRSRLPVLRPLGRCCYRADVELVQHGNAVAVKKTYRPSARSSMSREVSVLRDFRKRSTAVPRILAEGNNHILLEFVDGWTPHRRLFSRIDFPYLLPLKQTRELARVVKEMLENGWDPIDLSPNNNVLIERGSGAVRLIDFEFAHYRGAPIMPSQAYCFTGAPRGAGVETPVYTRAGEPYRDTWRAWTGLSLRSFLYDPPSVQRMKRAVIHPFWLLLFIARMAPRKIRNALRRRHYRRWVPGQCSF